MTAYYNENDKHAAQWLRNLISAGHIAPGVVDDRSIADVSAGDLEGFTQCHFFAGIGVWSHALRSAGWPDDRPIWTGSCPCQPFSGAGKREGVADARHLWPVWFDLIRVCRPGIVIGEQVASRDGLGWWDIVSGDLESEAYAAAALDLCVPGIGGPHIRQRLYWMADAAGARHVGTVEGAEGKARDETRMFVLGAERGLSGLADTSSAGLSPRERRELPGPDRHEEGRAAEQRGRAFGRLADADGRDARAEREQRSGEHGQQPEDCRAGRMVHPASERHGTHDLEPVAGWRECATGSADGALVELDDGRRTSPLNGFWRNADWLFCTDGKWRPVEPGLKPLAHGVAGRVGRLRAYGNAICAPLAVEFIAAVKGSIDAR